MSKNVPDFEPSQALFVPDNDPLLFYRGIVRQGITSLKSGGKMYVEIHEKYGKEVKALLQNKGYSEVIIHKDMQGKDRIVEATKTSWVSSFRGARSQSKGFILLKFF